MISGQITSDSLNLQPNNPAPGIAQANHNRIQTSLAAMNGPGGELLFGNGVFHVDTATLGPLLYPSNVTIRGLNRIASRILGNGGVAVFAPLAGTDHSSDHTERTSNVLFTNLSIWNTDSTAAGSICLDVRQVSNSRFEFLDFRQSEIGLRLGNVAWANAFTSIGAYGCMTAFHASNGCNENDFTDCRAAGVTYGFRLEDGLEGGAINSFTIDKCTIEAFTGAAVSVFHSGVTASNYADLRFLNNRFTGGPFGCHFEETGAGEINTVLVAGTHEDGIPNLLEWTINGLNYTDGPNQTTAEILGQRACTFIHQGKIWPVRPAMRDLLDSPTAAQLYTTPAGELAVRANDDAAAADLLASDITSQSDAPAGSRSEQVTHVRARAAGATAHAESDYTLSAAWGSQAALVDVASNTTDAHGRVSILADGLNIAANPTVTLTFRDGAWPTPPFIASTRGDALATAGEWRRTASTETTQTWTFVGTPVTGEVYILDYLVVG